MTTKTEAMFLIKAVNAATGTVMYVTDRAAALSLNPRKAKLYKSGRSIALALEYAEIVWGKSGYTLHAESV